MIMQSMPELGARLPPYPLVFGLTIPSLLLRAGVKRLLPYSRLHQPSRLREAGQQSPRLWPRN